MSIKAVLFALMVSGFHVEAHRKTTDYQVLAAEDEEANDQEMEDRAENYSSLADECVESACVENGKWDKDCCAKPTTGQCRDGYVFSYGGECSANGFNVCCKKIPTMVAFGECVKPACREKGKVDTDCCAARGKGSCEDGFEFSEGGNCHRNGAKETCCKQLPFPFKSYSITPMVATGDHVKEACMENGKWDKDCCAKPGEGTCMEGFMFSYGDTCSAFSNAHETVCKELPKKQEGGPHEARACMEHGKYDKDCCAKPGSGSCQEGFQFGFGERCASNGAKRTVCVQLPGL